jgi:hypothetical protein
MAVTGKSAKCFIKHRRRGAVSARALTCRRCGGGLTLVAGRRAVPEGTPTARTARGGTHLPSQVQGAAA